MDPRGPKNQGLRVRKQCREYATNGTTPTHHTLQTHKFLAACRGCQQGAEAIKSPYISLREYVNSCHPDPRCVWRWGPSNGSWHHFGRFVGHRGRTGGGLVLVRRRVDISLFPQKMLSILQQIPEDALQGSHRCPKMTKGSPRASQREPKGQHTVHKQTYSMKNTQ